MGDRWRTAAEHGAPARPGPATRPPPACPLSQSSRPPAPAACARPPSPARPLAARSLARPTRLPPARPPACQPPALPPGRPARGPRSATPRPIHTFGPSSARPRPHSEQPDFDVVGKKAIPPNVAWARPTLDDFGQMSRDIDHFLANIGPLFSTSVEICQSLENLARIWPTPPCRPDSVSIGQIWPGVDQTWAIAAEIRTISSMFRQIQPNLCGFGQIWPDLLAKFGPG